MSRELRITVRETDKENSMKIQDLKVTQAGLRNQPQLNGMVKFIKNGGLFNEQSISSFCDANPEAYRSNLIQVAKFPDGELFISDGHHRALAIALAGRNELHEDEYFIKDWSYDEYLDINFDQKWVTPFDPRTHVRLGEFFDFKQKVYEQLEVSQEKAVAYINQHPEQYCLLRSFDDVVSLGEYVGYLDAS